MKEEIPRYTVCPHKYVPDILIDNISALNEYIYFHKAVTFVFFSIIINIIIVDTFLAFQPRGLSHAERPEISFRIT